MIRLSDFVSNISGIAAIAIVVAGLGGFFIALIASVIGRPLDPPSAALVDRFINVLIGLAVGAGAGGTAVAIRMTRALEMNSMAAAQQRKNNES